MIVWNVEGISSTSLSLSLSLYIYIYIYIFSFCTPVVCLRCVTSCSFSFYNLSSIPTYSTHFVFVTFFFLSFFISSVVWNCIIQRLHLYREVRPPSIINECLRYDIKPPDGKALEICVMWSTPSLPLPPGLLWPGVVALDRVLSMSQIDKLRANKWLMLNGDCYVAILETI